MLGQTDGFKALDGKLVIPMKVYKQKTVTEAIMMADPPALEPKITFEMKRKERFDLEEKERKGVEEDLEKIKKETKEWKKVVREKKGEIKKKIMER